MIYALIYVLCLSSLRGRRRLVSLVRLAFVKRARGTREGERRHFSLFLFSCARASSIFIIRPKKLTPAMRANV